MSIPKIYGIKNCDTVKKARKWLEARDIAYEFMDLRGGVLSTPLLEAWLDQVGLDTLINKKSTSWRGLSEDQKKQLSRESATQLMQEIPTLIKRPVLVTESEVQVGFKPDEYQILLLKESSSNE